MSCDLESGCSGVVGRLAVALNRVPVDSRCRTGKLGQRSAQMALPVDPRWSGGSGMMLGMLGVGSGSRSGVFWLGRPLGDRRCCLLSGPVYPLQPLWERRIIIRTRKLGACWVN